MSKFYDWAKTLSYDADVTMVVGARGIGKTFGLRKQCVKDFLRDGSRFCEITRYKNEISGVSDGYFNRLEKLPDFDDYVFKTDARYAFIAEKPENEDDKPIWSKCGYFLALSDAQRAKKRTFDNVRRLIFDECILERSDRYHRYLPNEFGILANVVDTVSRERGDDASMRPRVYLLGNSLDLSNPYFSAYGVGTDLSFGYRWYAHKTFLLHYVESREYSSEKATRTVAGRMLANTEAGKMAIDNEFIRANSDFVKSKPKKAKFSFGLVCNGFEFGIWIDQTQGLYYVTDSFPRASNKPIYALTREDMKINYIAAKKVGKLMSYIQEMYYYSLIRYQNESVMGRFGEVLQMFGVR